jgi:hypothetical protein
MKRFETIFVRLLDEGTDCWRPTVAEVLFNGGYLLLPTEDYDATDEVWEFVPGTKVRIESRLLSGGFCKVATAIFTG